MNAENGHKFFQWVCVCKIHDTIYHIVIDCDWAAPIPNELNEETCGWQRKLVWENFVNLCTVLMDFYSGQRLTKERMSFPYLYFTTHIQYLMLLCDNNVCFLQFTSSNNVRSLELGTLIWLGLILFQRTLDAFGIHFVITLGNTSKMYLLNE